VEFSTPAQTGVLCFPVQLEANVDDSGVGSFPPGSPALDTSKRVTKGKFVYNQFKVLWITIRHSTAHPHVKAMIHLSSLHIEKDSNKKEELSGSETDRFSWKLYRSRTEIITLIFTGYTHHGVVCSTRVGCRVEFLTELPYQPVAGCTVISRRAIFYLNITFCLSLLCFCTQDTTHNHMFQTSEVFKTANVWT
jgi:hypothetical protein